MKNYTRHDESWELEIDAYLADAPRRRSEDWQRHLAETPLDRSRSWLTCHGVRIFF